MPTITPVPTGAGTLPTYTLIPALLVVRSDYPVGGQIYRAGPPVPGKITPAIRPPLVVRSDYGQGAMVYTSRPPLTPASSSPAWAFVQKASGSTTALGTSTAAALSVTAGDLLIVAVAGTGVSTLPSLSVADSLGNTYYSVGSPNANSLTVAQLFYAYNVLGGTCTVTVTSSGPAQLTMGVMEYSGFGTLDPLQGSGAGSGTGTSASSSLSAEQSRDLIVGCVTAGGGSTAAPGITGSPTYAERLNVASTSSATNYYYESLEIEDASFGTGVSAPSWTLAASAAWSAQAASFTPAILFSPRGVLPPLVVRADYTRAGLFRLTSLPASSALILRPLVVRGDYTRDGLVLQELLPVPGPIVRAVRPPLIIRSDHGTEGIVIWERPLLAPPPLKVSVAGGVFAPLIYREDYSRGASIFRVQPPTDLKINAPGGVILPLIVRSDYRRPARKLLEKPPFRPPLPGVPGFAVLVYPLIALGHQNRRRGRVYQSAYPPTPTGTVGPRLQLYRGPDGTLPNLLIGEPAWTADKHGLWIGDGTYDHFIGGNLVSAPASSASPGKEGQRAWDGAYFYFCVANNTWIRIAGIASW